MPLLSFSDPAHIPFLLDGRKQQTTRFQRAIPLILGDVLYCYYRPRMKKSCVNCIVQSCIFRETHEYVAKLYSCKDWNNYFGQAEVLHVRPLVLYHNNMEAWAIADGFKSLDEAVAWFRKTYGQNWEIIVPHLEVISFAPMWLEHPLPLHPGGHSEKRTDV